MPGAIPAISLTSLWKTWKAIRKELKNSSVRDVVDFLDYDVDPDVWMKRLLHHIGTGTYDPAQPLRFTLGKSKGFSRTMTFPSIPDLVLYRTLVDYFYDKVRRKQHKHVYFLRGQLSQVQEQIAKEPIQPDDLALPYYRAASQRSFLNWLNYDQYRKHLIFKKIHPFFVVTDVSNFFDTVLHTHVAEALHGTRVPSRTVGFLFFLLERLSIRQEYAGSHGISLPVDEFDCSRTLAHMVLFPHDDEMVHFVGEENYVRWMDDQNMGVNSKAHGLAVLAGTGRSLARLHLTPNTQKSKVLSLSEARRHFHLDLNQLIDKSDKLAKQVTKGQYHLRPKLRSEVKAIWKVAQAYEGVGEFGKILKRLYRIAGLAKGRLFRYRATKDILADPTSVERVSDYMRCTGTVSEYLDFADGLFNHPEQIYPDVNVALFDSFLRLEATGTEALRIRSYAASALNRQLKIPGIDDCAAVAPLLILRFGDRRSLRLLWRTIENSGRLQPVSAVRSAAIAYASFGAQEFAKVRTTASKLLRNHLSETIRFIEAIQGYPDVPNRYKARLQLSWDTVAGREYIDMRVLLMARLLLLNKSPKVTSWLSGWKTTLLKSSVSQFDQQLIKRWLT